MSFNSNITPGRPPLLWSDVNDAFTKINENFDILVATVGDGSGLTPIDFSTLDTNVSPAADNTYTLGEIGTRRWKTLFVNEYGTTGSDNTNGIYLGSAHVKGIGFTVDLPANSTVDGNLIIDPAKTWFNNIQIDNNENIEATVFNDSFGFTSGTGINLAVDSGAESIIVTNTGIITANAGSGISVSGTDPLIITNTGVRSLQSTTSLPSGRATGSGINISAGTGDNIRITNTGILEIVAGFGIQVSTEIATGITQVSFNSGVAPQTAFTRFHINGDLSVNDILSDNTADTFNFTAGYGITLTNNSTTDTMTVAVNNRIDIIGSVFADNSTLLVDGVQGRIVGPVFADVTGNLTGNVIGGTITSTSLRTSESKIALGSLAGETTQGSDAVAIGREAGRTTQGGQAVAIGGLAGETSQGNSSVAVGVLAGQTSQGLSAVALGNQAGQTSQGDAAIAIGPLAGETSQGTYAIAIGYLSGQTNQPANSIILNATGIGLNGSAAGFFVDPIRSTANGRPLMYNTTTKELFSSNVLEFIGSTISTSDSSGISVDVLTTFNTDVVFENDITVAERLIVKGSRVINLTQLQSVVAASSSFADFQARIAALI